MGYEVYVDRNQGLCEYVSTSHTANVINVTKIQVNEHTLLTDRVCLLHEHNKNIENILAGLYRPAAMYVNKN